MFLSTNKLERKKTRNNGILLLELMNMKTSNVQANLFTLTKCILWVKLSSSVALISNFPNIYTMTSTSLSIKLGRPHTSTPHHMVVDGKHPTTIQNLLSSWSTFTCQKPPFPVTSNVFLNDFGKAFPGSHHHTYFLLKEPIQKSSKNVSTLPFQIPIRRFLSPSSF